jgi:restriction system protein
VTNKAIQEAVTARVYYRCDRAMVVTNSLFTKSAIDAGTKTGCILIEREQLGAMVHSFRTKGQQGPQLSV